MPLEDLAEIEGFDDEVAAELQERARSCARTPRPRIRGALSRAGRHRRAGGARGIDPRHAGGARRKRDQDARRFRRSCRRRAASRSSPRPTRAASKLELDDANALIMAARAALVRRPRPAAPAASRSSARRSPPRHAPGDAAELGSRRSAAAPLHRHRRDRRPAALLRFVVGPDGAIVPDIEARLPGRGLWLTARRDIVEAARWRSGCSRARRGGRLRAAELADRVEAFWSRRCCRCARSRPPRRSRGRRV